MLGRVKFSGAEGRDFGLAKLCVVSVSFLLGFSCYFCRLFYLHDGVGRGFNFTYEGFRHCRDNTHSTAVVVDRRIMPY